MEQILVVEAQKRRFVDALVRNEEHRLVEVKQAFGQGVQKTVGVSDRTAESLQTATSKMVSVDVLRSYGT